jgi:adenylylsulfate kinase
MVFNLTAQRSGKKMTDEIKSKNIEWHLGQVTPDDRGVLLNQKGCVVWLTGLSGSGKSTIACALEAVLIQRRSLSYILDGDNVRHGLNKDLGFSAEDRNENIRRIGEVAALFSQAGVITIAAFISPYEEGRVNARLCAGNEHFVEVFLQVPLEECEKRDPKGLYKKARAGEINNMTGIDAPYEVPEAPELTLRTKQMDVEECVQSIVAYLEQNGFVNPRQV